MNHEITPILGWLLFPGLPILLIGFLLGTWLDYFSWADIRDKELNRDFKYRYKKPISAKEFAIENCISLKQSKKFLDNKLLEFGGIVVPKNGDSEYHFDISGFFIEEQDNGKIHFD